MKNLKELIKNDERVWFEIEDSHKKQFLLFAKDNNCTWMNGDEILPTENNCGNLMGINSENKLGFVATYCRHIKPINMPRIIKFSQILGEK
ncbi:MAG: hypothetical protein E7354_04300 [Clostridiales bacterium]|nr:hypothetical protein [Clostridiales bacterium]